MSLSLYSSFEIVALYGTTQVLLLMKFHVVVWVLKGLVCIGETNDGWKLEVVHGNWMLRYEDRMDG